MAGTTWVHFIVRIRSVQRKREILAADNKQIPFGFIMAQPLGDTVLLIGGTGKVASRIVPLLSSNGNQVLVASRSGTSPQLANTRGVKFDWSDPATFETVLENNSVTAVFMIPPSTLHPLPTMKPFIDLAISNDVKRFVLLSSSAVDSGDDLFMGKVSEYVISLDVEYAILRPSWFMENFSEVQFLASVRDEDQFTTATGDGKLSFVAADDIAAVAFRALTDQVSHNTDHLIFGPDLLSYDDVADLLTAELGRKIAHVKISEDEFAAWIMGYGLDQGYAYGLAGLETNIREGKEERVNDVVEVVTGVKPVAFKDFIKTNRGVWGRA